MKSDNYKAFCMALSNFWATVCKTVRPMLSDRCLSCPVCPVCNVGVLWPNGWADHNKTWHAGRPRPWPHCVRWGPSSSSPKRGIAPSFWPMFVVAKRLDGSRCHLVRRKASAQAVLLHGDQLPSQKGNNPQFSAHVYCGQTVGHRSYC